MQLQQILFSQGFGSRRECAALVHAGQVQVSGRTLADPHADVPTEGLVFTVQGQAWPWHECALVMLHKPAGYECSRAPRHHPGVLSLLPAPLRTRGVQPVGRLDEDTTGLLLFTDDGMLIHRLTSPKHHVRKVYRVTTRDPVDMLQIERLLSGVVLHDDPAPARAVAARREDSHMLEMTLAEGRYHQVKRMCAAVGNRVEALHRTDFGPLVLPPDLPAGRWRWLSHDEATALRTAAGASRGAAVHRERPAECG